MSMKKHDGIAEKNTLKWIDTMLDSNLSQKKVPNEMLPSYWSTTYWSKKKVYWIKAKAPLT